MIEVIYIGHLTKEIVYKKKIYLKPPKFSDCILLMRFNVHNFFFLNFTKFIFILNFFH